MDRRELFLNGGNRDHAVMRVLQMQPRFLGLDGVRLQQKNACYDLKAVADAVLNLLKQDSVLLGSRLEGSLVAARAGPSPAKDLS
jgi:hypothetical protein